MLIKCAALRYSEYPRPIHHNQWVSRLDKHGLYYSSMLVSGNLARRISKTMLIICAARSTLGTVSSIRTVSVLRPYQLKCRWQKTMLRTNAAT